MIDERYDRQLRLLEIGSEGQQAIEAHRARLPAGPGAGVALAYLLRAGVGAASIETGAPFSTAPEIQAFPHSDLFHFSGPLAVASGAHLALCELGRALERRRAR